VTRPASTQDDTTCTPFLLSVGRKPPLHTLTLHHVTNFHFLWCTTVHHPNAIKRLLQRILCWMLPLACEGEIFLSTSTLGIGRQCIPYLNAYCSWRSILSVPCQTSQQFLSTYSRTLWARRAGRLYTV